MRRRYTVGLAQFSTIWHGLLWPKSERVRHLKQTISQKELSLCPAIPKNVACTRNNRLQLADASANAEITRTFVDLARSLDQTCA